MPSYSNDVHHECELVLLIGCDADNLTPEQALAAVAGYGVGLDMTARDVQTELKQKGHPWTRGKGFRGAACVSEFVAAQRVSDPTQLQFSLRVNDQLRQHGNTNMMLFGVAQLVSWLSCEYGLLAGDLIYTGTPAGVAPLHDGDRLHAELHGLVSASWKVER
jgi:2-keto-4-pentenoate hydratase/2-oxohepta-3-ene-1,7-dioic acid hydratase in catechol pathway